jgi:hypothetical protein
MLPLVGGAGRILLVTFGLLRSESEHARLNPLGSVAVGSVLCGRSETPPATEKANEKKPCEIGMQRLENKI